jgi:hypothetical protein
VKSYSSEKVLRDFCVVSITGSTWSLDTLDCPTAGVLPSTNYVVAVNGASGSFTLDGAGVSCSAITGGEHCSVTGGASAPSTSNILKGNGSGGILAAVAGTDYVVPSGNVATATALAANGSNCGTGQAAQGVDASGNAEGCFTPAGSGGSSLPLIVKSIHTAPFATDRAVNTVYHNTTGYALVVMYTDSTSMPTCVTDSSSSPTTVISSYQTYVSSNGSCYMAVAPGNYYKVTGTAVSEWMEWNFTSGTFSQTEWTAPGTRDFGNVYQNTNAGFMIVTAYGPSGAMTVYCDSSSSPTTAVQVTDAHSGGGRSVMFIVPAGYYYKITHTGGGTVVSWTETVTSHAATQVTATSIRSNAGTTSSVPYQFGDAKFVSAYWNNGTTGTANLFAGPMTVSSTNACCWIMGNAWSGGGNYFVFGFITPVEKLQIYQDSSSSPGLTAWAEWTLTQ